MYRYVTDIKGMSQFVADYQKVNILALDTETTGLNCFTNQLLLLAVKAGKTTFIFDARKLGKKDITYILQLINDSGKLVIGHNIKFDLKFLFNFTGEMLENVYDTMLAEMLTVNGIAKDRFPSLATLVDKYCGVTLDKSVREEFYKNPDQPITESQLQYTALDVEYLETIRERQLITLGEQKQLQVLELESKLIPVVASMEINGIDLDKSAWLKLADKAEEQYKALGKELVDNLFSDAEVTKRLKKCKTLQEAYDLFSIPYKTTKKNLAIISQPLSYEYYLDTLKIEFNLGSTKQLTRMLQILGYEIKSTSADALSSFDGDEVIDALKEYREKKKLATSFGQNFIDILNPVTGKIHTNFNQLGARSGRFSSGGDDGLNMQNIISDEEYRRCFIAPPGYKIVGGDFSQEEYRLAGAVSGEQEIIQAYKAGKDMHTKTASMMNNDIPLEEVTKDQRRDAKPVNFSNLYGTSAYGMSKKQKITQDRAEWIIATFWKGYPTLAKFRDAFQAMILERKYSVTLMGRKRFFDIPTVFVSGKDREKYLGKIRREGFNHIIQGTGADIVKLALCRIYYENPFGDGLKIILTVHDEIQCLVKDEYVEEAEKFLKKVMEEEEQKFLGDIPALAEIASAPYWKH